VLKVAAERPGEVEVCVSKTGFITSPWNLPKRVFATFLSFAAKVPGIDVGEYSSALIDQVVNGFEKDTLVNDDLVAIAKRLKGHGK
jgi:hypothetical protein